jgi:hypothetical protein
MSDEGETSKVIGVIGGIKWKIEGVAGAESIELCRCEVEEILVGSI